MIEQQQKFMSYIESLQNNVNKVRNRTYNFDVKPLFSIFDSKKEGLPVMVDPKIMVWVQVFDGIDDKGGFFSSPNNIIYNCEEYPRQFQKRKQTA